MKRKKAKASIQLPRLKRGDIIQYHNKEMDGTVWNWFYWSHTMMYIGKGKVIHSAGRGVETIGLKEKLEHERPRMDNIAVLRIKKSVNVDIDAVIRFAEERIGRPYDMWSLYLLTKQPDFPFPPFYGYYCTELIWAAYLVEADINLDRNRIGWVRPIDIYASEMLDRVYVMQPDAVIVPGFHLFDLLPSEEEEPRNIYYTKTRDGWDLGIRRYRPETDKVSEFPVVLCHGLAANKNSCDFGEEDSDEWQQYSLAAYLSHGGEERGLSFDVFVPELRGRGTSVTFDSMEYPGQYNWCLDEYVDFDMPAIVECIENTYKREGKKSRRLFWVGKSMGGMLAYAYGIWGEGNQKFKGVVTLGSPVKFDRSAEVFNFIPKRILYNLHGPFHAFRLLTTVESPSVDIILSLLAIREHIKPAIFEMYLRKAFNNTLSSKVLKHFAICKEHNDFCRFPRRPWLFDVFDSPWLRKRFLFVRNFFAPFSYTKHLSEFRCPLLIVAGAGDQSAHPDDVKYAFDHVGSKDKLFLLYAKNAVDEDGKVFSSYDYGHLDLNLGIKAREEVYAKIYEWLKDQVLNSIYSIKNFNK